MKTRVLVVGANGFLGTTLITTDSKTIDFIKWPTNDWTLPGLENKIKTVVFLRSISSPTFVQQHPRESQKLNIDQTVKYIEKCLMSNLRVVFTSSDVVYGDTGVSIVNEQDTINPYGLYAMQKATIENRFSGSENFISLRLSLVTGNGSKLRGILAKESRPTIADSFVRSPINVRHVVSLIHRVSGEELLMPEHKVLNVGGRQHISVFELAKFEARKFGLNTPIRTLPTELDLEARPQTVRMYSDAAENLTGSQFGFD